MSLPSIPTHYCVVGKHTYPAVFTSCPYHKTRLWNVRIRTRFNNIKKPGGGTTNDWTFQQEAMTPRSAAFHVVTALFGDTKTAELFLRKDPEVWKATKKGISSADIGKGYAE